MLNQQTNAKIYFITFNQNKQIYYSFGISVSDSHAISAPSINISLNGTVPLYEQVIKISFNCRRNYNAEVDVNIYLNLTLASSPENVTSLTLRRKKICFTSTGSSDFAEGIYSGPDVHRSTSYYSYPSSIAKGSIGYEESSSTSSSDMTSSSKPLSPYYPSTVDSIDPPQAPVIHQPGRYPPSNVPEEQVTPSSTIATSVTNESNETTDTNPIFIAIACAIGVLIILAILLYLCYSVIQHCFFKNSPLHSNVVSSLNYPHTLPRNHYDGTLTNSQHYYYSGIPSLPGTLIRNDKNTTQIYPFTNDALYCKEATNSLQAKSIKSNATASSHKRSDYSVVSFVYQDLGQATGTYYV